MGSLSSREAASEWFSLTQQATGWSCAGSVSSRDINEVASGLLLLPAPGLRPGQEGSLSGSLPSSLGRGLS